MCHVMNVTVTQLYDGACRAGAQRKRSHRDMRSQIAQFNGEPVREIHVPQHFYHRSNITSSN